MTYVSRVSMSMNFSGGLQKLVHVPQLKNEPKCYEMSKNFRYSPYNLNYVIFQLNKRSQL